MNASSADLFDEPAPQESQTAFDLDFASQGQEGLDRVRRAVEQGTPYMMAFLDVRMPPGLDGIETAARLWDLDPRLQIVICTAFSDYSWAQVSAKLKLKDRFVVLKKPFDVIEVEQLANAFTEKWILHHQVEADTRKLQESEERYRFLANAMPGLVWTARPDGSVDYANQRIQEYSGRPFEQNRDWGWQEMIHPDDLPDCIERWTHSIRTGSPYQMEYRVKRAGDGVYRWHLVRAVAMRDARNAIQFWAGNAVDIDDQKRAEESQLRLQTSALEAVANGVMITDPAGNIRWVNPAFTLLTGYSAQESVGKTPAVLKSGAQDREFYAAMWSTILKGECWRGELVNRRKDGSHYCEEMTITPVLDPNGKIQNFVAVKQDISSRKEFEQALSRERDLLQNLMDSLPDYIYFKDLKSRFVRINLAHARALGLTDPKEAIGKSDADFFSGHFARQTLADEQRILATGQPLVDSSEELRTLSGETRWVSATKVPTRDADGQISGLVGISRNITERKRVEEELRAQQESVRALTENAPDCIARIDRDLRFVYVNRALENILGLPGSEILGKTHSELGLKVAGEWNKAIQRVFQTGETTTFVFQFESREGNRVLEARLVPEHSTFGGVLYVLAITRDITEQTKAEKQKQLMEVQLRQAQKLESIGQLAAGIAHEINTPTQYVADNTRFLQESFDSITSVLKAYEDLLGAVRSNTATAPTSPGSMNSSSPPTSPTSSTRSRKPSRKPSKAWNASPGSCAP